MPRNMSFFHTQEQVRERRKDVTRRLGKGWRKLKPGDRFWAIVKGQGLRKGEHVERICLLECVSNRVERLDWIMPGDVAREGFPDNSPAWFVAMFCRSMGCRPNAEVNRIEFKYVEAD
jgi:hypothetical protein